MARIDVFEREIIDGKPHLGVWVGSFIKMSFDVDVDELYHKKHLRYAIRKGAMNLSVRNETFIEKSNCDWFNPRNHVRTIAIKGLRYGRAFEVLKTFRKKVGGESVKVMVNGHRKRKKRRMAAYQSSLYALRFGSSSYPRLPSFDLSQ